MIKSKKTLLKNLQCNEQSLSFVIANIENFYYLKREAKRTPTGEIKKDAKGNPVYRDIYPSKDKLKKFQKRLNICFFSKVVWPTCVKGAVKGQTNIKNAAAHLGRKYKFCTDLKSFFPSVTNKQVYSALIAQDFSPDVARIITHLTTYKGFLPQGTPTASYLANLVFLEVDHKLLQFCKLYDITYTRYVDDLTFSSPKCFKKLTKDILKIVKKAGFRISHNKTSYSHNPEITGVKTGNNYLSLGNKAKTKLYQYKADENWGPSYKSMDLYARRVRSKDGKITLTKIDKILK